MTIFKLRVLFWKVREIVYISVVLVPVLEEGNDRVDKKEKDETEDEDFLCTDLEYRSSDTQVWIRLINKWLALILCIIFVTTGANRGRWHFWLKVSEDFSLTFLYFTFGNVFQTKATGSSSDYRYSHTGYLYGGWSTSSMRVEHTHAYNIHTKIYTYYIYNT